MEEKGTVRVSSPRLTPPAALAGLIAIVFVGHVELIERYPIRRLIGDEGVYVSQARQHAREGWATLLPGNLEFSKRPSFWGHVLSRVAPDPSVLEDPPDAENEDNPGGAKGRIIKTAYLDGGRRLNTFLLLGLLIALYAQGRALRLGGWVSLAPVVLLAVQPRLVFQVHSLWSEMLFMALQTAAFACLLWYPRTGRSVYAAVAGLFMGFAILTRSTSLLFAPLIPIWLFWAGGARGRIVRRLLAPAVFAVAVAAVVTPQLRANYASGRGYRLAANTWLNVMIGMNPRTYHAGLAEAWRDARGMVSGVKRGKSRPEKLVSREEKARQTVLNYLRLADPWDLFLFQVNRGFNILTRGRAALQWSVDKKTWPGQTTDRLRPWIPVDRLAWLVLLAGGLLGLGVLAFRDRGWALPGAYAAYYLLAMMAVPINGRISIQLLPFLCLGTVGLLRLRARPAPDQ